MYDQRAKTALDQADQLYFSAQEELARPEEDVVPYMVCRNAFKAVNKYLIGYLIINGLDVHSSMSIEDMVTNCRKLNEGFKALNLSPFYSTSEDEDVWMDMKTMYEFIDLATQTKEIVKQNSLN